MLWLHSIVACHWLSKMHCYAAGMAVQATAARQCRRRCRSMPLCRAASRAVLHRPREPARLAQCIVSPILVVPRCSLRAKALLQLLLVPPRSLTFASAAPALAAHRPLLSGCSETACKAVIAPCGTPPVLSLQGAPGRRSCRSHRRGEATGSCDEAPRRLCVCTCGPAAQQRKLGAPSCLEMICMRLIDVCCARRRCRRELASHRRRSP